jgi:ubiquinone/menaquinone biosynthesis C-methylase UbiE
MVKIAQVNYPKISFTQEDVENMSFHDRSFDVVILNYLLLHVPDPRKALLEAKRVLRQKGKLVFTMWLAPSFSPGLQMIFSAIKEYADTSVIPPAQDIFLFSDAEYSTKFLAENGFSNIKTSIFATFWQVSSGESFFSAIQAGTRMGGMIDLQQPNIKEKIKAKMVKDIEQFKADNEYLIPMPSIIVCGEL